MTALLPPHDLPPHNAEAERNTLGCMIRNNSCIGDVAALVKSADFYRDANQRIFGEILKLRDRHKPVDAAILADGLVKSGQLEDVGGYPYVAELLESSPTGANAEYYARIVRDRSIQRQLLRVGIEITQEAQKMTGEVQEMLASAEQRVLAIAELGVEGETVTLSEAIDEVYQRIDDRHQQAAEGAFLRGVATGWPDLDEITCGLQNGELIVIAARPSVGKTAFGINLANHAAINLGIPTLFASLEQSNTELTERLVCMRAKVDGHKIRKGRLSANDMQAICTAGDDMRAAPLWWDDSPGQNMLRICANARRLKARKGVRLVIVDYLQLIEPEDRRAPRQEQVSAVSRRLKHLARELKIPVVAMAQVNRGSENRTDKRPKLSDLRESGAIEQDADVVILLHRPEPEDENAPPMPCQQIEVDVAKQRNGPTDRIVLMFRKSIMKFENFDSMAHAATR